MFNPLRTLSNILVKQTEAYKASDARMQEIVDRVTEIEKEQNLPPGTLTK